MLSTSSLLLIHFSSWIEQDSTIYKQKNVNTQNLGQSKIMNSMGFKEWRRRM